MTVEGTSAEGEAIRVTLVQRLQELIEHQARMDARLRHVAGLPDRWPERAALLGDEEVLARLGEHERAEVDAIRAALARLEAGTYGRCARCGEGIDEARLRAVPAASLCGTCAGGVKVGVGS